MATGLPESLSDRNHEWVLDFSNFRSAWSTTKGKGITIAHPDTGWTLHPELVTPNYRRTSDVSQNFYDYRKVSSIAQLATVDAFEAHDHLTGPSAHGTSTAGVIVSPRGDPDGLVPERDLRTARFPERSPSAFVSGAAPEATVITFRVANWVIMMDDADTALTECIYFCIGLRKTHNIDVGVMSISLGGSRIGTEQRIKTALKRARSEGIVVIAAAGQFYRYGRSRWLPTKVPFFPPAFPGSSPHTICAAGCDFEHNPLDGALYGEEVDITAPGINVWQPTSATADMLRAGARPFTVARSDGTSYAAALTAAACALWQSAHGRDKLIGIYGRHRLFTAFKYCVTHSPDTPDGWDQSQRGAGVLDVDALLKLPLPSVPLIEAFDKSTRDED
jgi:thermitase